MSNLISKMVDNIAADTAAGRVTGPVCGTRHHLAVRKQIAKTKKLPEMVCRTFFWGVSTTFPV